MASSSDFKRWENTVEENNKRQISAFIDLAAWPKHEVINLGRLEAYRHVPTLKEDFLLFRSEVDGKTAVKVTKVDPSLLTGTLNSFTSTIELIPGTTHLEINIRVKKQELITDINQKVCPRNPMKALLWKMGFTKKLIASSKQELLERISEHKFKPNVVNGKCAILSETKDRMIVYELGDIMIENKHKNMIFIPYAKPFGIWIADEVSLETMTGVAKYYMPYTKIV